MSRETIFFLLVGLVVILAAWLGWLRRKVICQAFSAIYDELKQRQVELSAYESQLLLGQLSWNQNAVIESEPHAELRAIKEPHVQSLKKLLRLIRAGLWILYGMALGALLLLAESW
jgi:hypothetical protein